MHRDHIARFALLVLLAAAATACDRTRVYQSQFLAFGTLVEVTIYGTDPALAERAFAAARRDFEHMHKAWHAWRPSTVTRANAAIAAGRSLVFDPELRPLIARAAGLSQQSRGLFNPAIGGLVALWGFHGDDYAGRRPPPAAKIGRLVRRDPSMDDLALAHGRLSSVNRDVQLDFGAYAKGVGVGRVAEHLRSLGLENFIVNAGGDLRAVGAHGDRPWRIGIRDPRDTGVIASVEIERDESVFTSGDYERYFEFNGERYHHILDPRTGYPARGAISVTVVHADPGAADAAATAIFVAGPIHWRAIARAMSMRDVMLIDARGRAHMTPSMAARVRFETDPPPPVITSDER